MGKIRCLTSNKILQNFFSKPLDFFTVIAYNASVPKGYKKGKLIMTDYIIRAQHFIRELFPYVMNWYDPTAVRIAVRRFNTDSRRAVKVASGAARIAIMTSDYVVKFDYDEESATVFGGCESECKFYDFACSEGYGYLFAAITPYEYGGITFYIMPRIRGIGNESRPVSYGLTYDELDFLVEYLDDLHEYNYGVRDGKTCVIDYACNKLTFANM